jgi:hypothetical protein
MKSAWGLLYSLKKVHGYLLAGRDMPSKCLILNRMICKNCGHTTEGDYCSHCGQKPNPGRLNFSYLLSEITNTVFQFHTGFLYTLKKLFVAPGELITDFLQGKRKRYFKPISYLLILSTVYFIVTWAINESTWIGDFISGWNAGSKEKDSPPNQVLMWFSEKYAYSSLLLLPIFSFASYLSFFRFHKNYIEHIVINAYITGQQALFYTFFALLGLILEHKLLEIVSFLVSASYTFFVYDGVFKEGSRGLNMLRSAASYALFLIFAAAGFIFVFLVSKI